MIIDLCWFHIVFFKFHSWLLEIIKLWKLHMKVGGLFAWLLFNFQNNCKMDTLMVIPQVYKNQNDPSDSISNQLKTWYHKFVLIKKRLLRLNTYNVFHYCLLHNSKLIRSYSTIDLERNYSSVLKVLAFKHECIVKPFGTDWNRSQTDRFLVRWVNLHASLI